MMMTLYSCKKNILAFSGEGKACLGSIFRRVKGVERGKKSQGFRLEKG
jgi:hypothetical protein